MGAKLSTKKPPGNSMEGEKKILKRTNSDEQIDRENLLEKLLRQKEIDAKLAAG
jgi:hypothetical protein